MRFRVGGGQKEESSLVAQFTEQHIFEDETTTKKSQVKFSNSQ